MILPFHLAVSFLTASFQNSTTREHIVSASVEY